MKHASNKLKIRGKNQTFKMADIDGSTQAGLQVKIIQLGSTSDCIWHSKTPRVTLQENKL